jgi:DNA-binding PadR family transcriptional regulator
MWASKKSQRKIFDTLILAILDHHPSGLTGYAVMKELENTLKPIPVPGTGTIYPRLDKMVEQKDLSKTGNQYSLTFQGKAKITQDIEDILNDSVVRMQVFYQNLLSHLPLNNRSRFASILPENFQFFAGPINKSDNSQSKKSIFNADSFKCNYSKNTIRESLDDLKLTKTRLERAKTIIRQRSDSDIEAISQQIKSINNKIIELQNRKKDWIKISIDDDSDDAEESE